MKLSFRPRLQTLLLTVNGLVLLLPIGAILAFELYETELIRRTESNLINQGALLAAGFKAELLRAARLEELPIRGIEATSDSPLLGDTEFTPVVAQLSMKKEKQFPPAPPATTAVNPPEKLAMTAGKAMEPILREAQRITFTGVRIVDHKGVVVASSGSEYGLSLEDREEVQEALQGQYSALLRQRISDEPLPAYTSLSRGSEVRVFIAIPVVGNDKQILGAVVLSRSPMSMGKGLYLIRSQLYWAAPVIIVLLIVFSLFATFIISSPIKALIRQAEQVKKGQPGAAQLLRHPGTVEVAKLSASITEMARSLEKRADYIKTFAANVSHEFKTPLSGLKGSLELVRNYGDDMSDTERETFLSNMAKDVERLNRMVGKLLELARADVIKPGGQQCDVDELFRSLKQRYSKAGQVVFHCLGKVGPVNMDCETLESILTNLIGNSLQHGGQDVTVRVTAERKNGRLELLISDTGGGISAANRQKIFLPFFTTARESGGSGLGLSISRTLIRAHGGEIALLPDNESTIFRIIL
jgi:signal transduction histidine kinase